MAKNNKMSDTLANNKRIAKNTIMLYIRMLFLMAVNLYTSRVVLQTLGVEDYGIYNAVAGFIAMFSMVSASISGAISRFITFVLGQGDQQKLNKVFSTALIIQIAIALLVVFLVEAIGVWFLNTHMTIPIERNIAANWVLQFALLTFIFNLWSTPYNASLIAHEKMNAFAYIGIFEGCANLAIAFLIMTSPFDTLIFYALLMCLVAFITRIIYTVYCKKHFSECTFHWVYDKVLFKEMFGFAGWNFVGSISGLLREQGINILFNIYFGPTINAARGLASQVNTAIGKFSQNFFTAVQPQITKTYACNNINEAHSLVLRSSRFAFILMMAFVIPIIFETELLLKIWLKEVPTHTTAFVQIIMLFSLLESFSYPLIHLMLATGKIKKYQLVVGSVNILNFPVAWLILLFGGSPELSQLSIVIFSIVALVLRVIMLKPITKLPVKQFLISTVLRCLCLLIICIMPALLFVSLMEENILRFCCNIITTEIAIILVAFIGGLTPEERKFVIGKIKIKYLRKQ